MHLFVVV